LAHFAFKEQFVITPILKRLILLLCVKENLALLNC